MSYWLFVRDLVAALAVSVTGYGLLLVSYGLGY